MVGTVFAFYKLAIGAGWRAAQIMDGKGILDTEVKGRLFTGACYQTWPGGSRRKEGLEIDKIWAPVYLNY